LGDRTAERCADLATRASALIKGFDPVRADALLKDFINRNRAALSGLPDGMNWFLPRELGGFGLPITRDVVFSPHDRKLAKSLMELEDPSAYKSVVSFIRGGLLPRHVELTLNFVRQFEIWKPTWVTERPDDPLPTQWFWAFGPGEQFLTEVQEEEMVFRAWSYLHNKAQNLKHGATLEEISLFVQSPRYIDFGPAPHLGSLPRVFVGNPTQRDLERDPGYSPKLVITPEFPRGGQPPHEVGFVTCPIQEQGLDCLSPPRVGEKVER